MWKNFRSLKVTRDSPCVDTVTPEALGGEMTGSSNALPVL